MNAFIGFFPYYGHTTRSGIVTHFYAMSILSFLLAHNVNIIILRSLAVFTNFWYGTDKMDSRMKIFDFGPPN